MKKKQTGYFSLKRRLTSTTAACGMALIIVVILYWLLAIVPGQRSISRSAQLEVENTVLSIAVILGQEMDAALIPDAYKSGCDRILIENAQGERLLDIGDNRIDTTVYSFRGNGPFHLAESWSHVFYEVELSGERTLSVAVPKDAAISNGRSIALYALITALFAVFVFCIYRYFRRKIILPILDIESAVDNTISGDMNFNINCSEKNGLYPLSMKLNSMLAQIQEVMQREYSVNILLKQSEIDALQSQINPHFLYNTLDSIRGQAILQGSFEIANLLKALSGIFRYSISKTNQIMTLRDEFIHMDHYLTIQQYRFSNKFDVVKEFEGDEEELLDLKVPKLTIQPIVENSVFHGLETKKGKGRIDVYTYTTEQRLIIEIEDNGIGIETGQLEKLNKKINAFTNVSPEEKGGSGTGIALRNVNQRIKLLYGATYGINVFSTIGIGTRVQILLPIIRE